MELSAILEKEKADVALLQEPYTFRGSLPGFYGGRTVLAECSGSRILSGIVVVNPALGAMALPHLSNEYFCACEVRVKQAAGRARSIYFVSAYFKHSKPIDGMLVALERILDHLAGQEVVIGADVNAKSPLWHDITLVHQQRCTRAQKLEQLIAARNLTI